MMRFYSVDSSSLSPPSGITIFFFDRSILFLFYCYFHSSKHICGLIYQLYSLFYTQNQVLFLPKKKGESFLVGFCLVKICVDFSITEFQFRSKIFPVINWLFINFLPMMLLIVFQIDSDCSNNFLSLIQNNTCWDFPNLLKNLAICVNLMNYFI